MPEPTSDRSQAAGYLGAMIDGEGSVTLDGSVTIWNCDPDVIDAAAGCCDVLGISYTVKRRERLSSRNRGGRLLANGSGTGVRHRSEFRLRIRTESLCRLYETIPICSPKKRTLLREIVRRRGGNESQTTLF